MAIQNRNTTLPAIWAETAQTEIPTPPVAGVTYRDTTLNSTAIDKAWPFKTIVDSSDFNQHAFLQDTLIKEAEQYGIMRWNNTVTYKKGGLCLAQDEKVYQALRDNQSKEPTSNPDDWKIPFAIDADIVHKTGDETISGVKTFEDDITAPNQVDYTNIANCITAIPQDIKLELADGTLTLKAGSQPRDGRGNVINVNSDKTLSVGLNVQSFVFYNYGTQNLVTYSTARCFSGDSQPSGIPSETNIWFDTANKVMKLTNNGGSSWSEYSVTLPLGLITSDTTQITSIDQIFNGFGYIGSTIFALPGVEGLIPNGFVGKQRNNTKFTTTRVLTRTYGSNETYTYAVLMISSSEFTTNYVKYYNDKNLNIDSIGRTSPYANCGTASFVNGRITSFKPKTVFQATDYYDFKQLDDSAAKLDENNVFTQPITVDVNPINFIAKNSKIEVGVTPSSYQFCGYDWRGKNGSRLAWLGIVYGNQGTKRIEFQKLDTNLTELNFETFLTKIATPAAGANGTEAVNASWTNTNVNNFFNTAGRVTAKCMPNYAAGVGIGTGTTVIPKDSVLIITPSQPNYANLTVTVNGVEVFRYSGDEYLTLYKVPILVPKNATVVITGNLSNATYYPLVGA